MSVNIDKLLPAKTATKTVVKTGGINIDKLLPVKNVIPKVQPSTQAVQTIQAKPSLAMKPATQATIKATPEKKWPLGFIGEAAKAAYDTVKSTLDNAAERLTEAAQSVMAGDKETVERAKINPLAPEYLKTQTTPLQRGVKLGEAAVGVANIGFLPVTTQMEAAKKLPVIKYPAQGASYLFEKAGELGSKALGTVVDNLPVSQETKETIKPLSEELGALITQIVGVKAVHGVAKKGISTKALPLKETTKAKISTGAKLTAGFSMTPFSTAYGLAGGMITAKIQERKSKGIEITPEEGTKIVNEVKTELPKEYEKMVQPELPLKTKGNINIDQILPKVKPEVLPEATVRPQEAITEVIKPETTKIPSEPVKTEIKEDPLIQEAKKYGSAEEFVNENLEVDTLLPSNRPLGEKTLADLKYTGNKVNIQKAKVSPIEDAIKKAKSIADSGGDGSVGNYEVYDVLKKVKNGRIKVYHGTSETGANAIGGGWAGLKDGSYLSLTKGDEKETMGVYGAKYYADIADKYGKNGRVLEFEIPLKNIAIDNTTGELRFVSDKTKSQLTDIWNKAQEKPVEIKPEVKPTKPSGVAKSIEAKAIEKPKDTKFRSRVYDRLKNELPENMREDLEYTRINQEKDIDKAIELIQKDKNEAYSVAMGVKEAPKDQTATAVNIALSEKALEEGNHALYGQLVKNRSLAQTRRGQEIVAEKASVSDNSTARYVKELISAKLDNLGKLSLPEKLKKASAKEKALERIDKEVKKAQDATKRKSLDLAEAQSLINKLMC